MVPLIGSGRRDRRYWWRLRPLPYLAVAKLKLGIVLRLVAVLMLIVSALVWAIASAHRNYSTARKGRVGVLVSVGAAALAGAGVAWMNWLINVGQQL